MCWVQDATQLALKIVTNYALSDAGITTYASPGQSLGFMRKSFEASYSNLILLSCTAHLSQLARLCKCYFA